MTHEPCECQQCWECTAKVFQARVEKLAVALAAAKIPHEHCDDSWFCCGKCAHPDHGGYTLGEGANGRVGGVCHCGADAHNAAIDAALK